MIKVISNGRKNSDYIDVIVQVFDSEARKFYDFDRLLDEAELIDISQLEKEVDEEN